MPRIAALLAIAMTLFLRAAASQPAQPGLLESPYFPLKVGTQWNYRMDGLRYTTRVVKHEQIGKVWCARLETKSGNSVTTESIGVQKDGMYRFRGDGMDVMPPLCLCKLPPKAGTEWKVESRIAALDMKGNFTLTEEPITVGKKKYETVKVVFTDLKKGEDKIAMTTWYAAGVGMVKQTIKTGAVDLLIELEKFEAGE